MKQSKFFNFLECNNKPESVSIAVGQMVTHSWHVHTAHSIALTASAIDPMIRTFSMIRTLLMIRTFSTAVSSLLEGGGKLLGVRPFVRNLALLSLSQAELPVRKLPPTTCSAPLAICTSDIWYKLVRRPYHAISTKCLGVWYKLFRRHYHTISTNCLGVWYKLFRRCLVPKIVLVIVCTITDIGGT